MTPYTLTIVDLTGIQNYIFGSNRLSDNIGASYLAQAATDSWVHKLLPQADMALEDAPKSLAEIVYSGGGNAVILFRELAAAKKFAKEYSEKLLCAAPGLDAVIAHYEFDWETDALGGTNGVLSSAQYKLAQLKRNRLRNTPLAGLGVTLNCRATMMPAVAWDTPYGSQETRPISAEIAAKNNLTLHKQADTRLKTYLGWDQPEQPITKYSLTNQLDQLGRSYGESSYIAVVHADGNGMGKRIKKLIERYDSPQTNRECVTKLRAFSQAVEQASKTALMNTMNILATKLYLLVDRQNQSIEAPLANDEQLWADFIEAISPNKIYPEIFPVRPLIFGGDDVTFVCDGRLGLALATTYLIEFERSTQDILKETIYASAGVAIVKAHYPFARAYQLAEELCKHAKSQTDIDRSMLDWHIAATGISDELSAIREREYCVAAGNLTPRPLPLTGDGLSGRTWATWQHYQAIFAGFLYPQPKSVASISDDTKDEDGWNTRTNKLIGLREVLRKGGNEVKQYLKNFKLPDLPVIPTATSDMQTTGWDSHYCGYFDAIEALDFYLPLAEEIK